MVACQPHPGGEGNQTKTIFEFSFPSDGQLASDSQTIASDI